MNNEKMIVDIKDLCISAKEASNVLNQIPAEQKKEALLQMAEFIKNAQDEILTINEHEVTQAIAKNIYSEPFIDRLQLNPQRLDAMVEGLKQIADLPDPVGRILASWTVPSGLKISRVSTPLGVIAVIYEARPNVTTDAAGLCLKSGNAVILRGGTASSTTNQLIVKYLQSALKKTKIIDTAIQYVPIQDREALDFLLKQYQYIDVIVPRGSLSLIERICQNSQIPVFRHLQGICHTYIHLDASLEMAVRIICNAKLRRPGICGATETLLIDREIAEKFLPVIIDTLINKGCEIRGDEFTQKIDARVIAATEQDWSTEYLDAILSIKVVENIDEAIKHINQYSSSHTESIITNDNQAAEKFLKKINSAVVMHNCSTQFSDGGEFGMGAEIGIATGKLHARGPVGVEQLTTFKYLVEGQGQIRK